MGQGAEQIAHLFRWMAWGAAAIWAAVTALLLYSIHGRRRLRDEHQARLLIIGGGIVFPALVLTTLLTYGLALLPDLLAAAPPGSVRIEVTGEQWWWRVRYPSGHTHIELANELRLPAGEHVELELRAADVIHSLWIPSLGGKTDMIPGRTTRMRLGPSRSGVYRGVCAEYCGASHALMALDVHVVPREQFDAWLAAQARPAAGPHDGAGGEVAAADHGDAGAAARGGAGTAATGGDAAARGGDLFHLYGCGACHTVRGTPARGQVGPDLTHVASRRVLAAGTISHASHTGALHRVPDRRAALKQWIARSESLKPGVHMPAFDMLDERELDALAAYLEGLR